MTTPTLLRRAWLPLLLTLAGFHACHAAAPAAPPDYVWLEGEDAAGLNVKPNIGGWGHKEFLSGEKWLHVSIDAEKVDASVPGGGVTMEYPFTAPKQARYEVWDRIGYEFARSPFEWRVDAGAWKTVTPDDLTTDLMELETWNEVAWLKLGDASLAPGAHRLQVRLPKTRDAKGQTARILYASDALCISVGPFSPNGRLRPGEEEQTPETAEAARKVFELPRAQSAGSRASVKLNGLWQVCRADEQIPGLTAQPMEAPPAEAHWRSIAVPGDRNVLRPDLLMAHRLWYRTRVNVPEAYAGRSFFLTFPENNLNTTVYVNGVRCGFNKNPFAHFDIDVTKGIRPGVNEVWVGIRDAWYGYSNPAKDSMRLRRKFNLPLDFSHQGFQDLAYPVWNGFQSGIIATPTLTAAGPAYAADVFVKPSVARKELALEVTLSNPGATGQSGELLCEAVNPQTGAVEKALAARPFSLPAGGEDTLELSGRWTNPRVWWPDDPQMYTLRTTVKIGGRAADVSEMPFGFREWSNRGKDFTLNGVTWPMWADLQDGDTPQAFLANYRKTNQRTMRLMGVSQGGTHWKGLTPDEALDFFDRNGVVVRRCGPLDGEAIGYALTESDPEIAKAQGTDAKLDLMQNWRDQMVAQVKGERNHPSVQIWSIENEYLFINIINLLGGNPVMDRYEAEVKKTSDAVREADPTRLVMTDGGGANKDNAMPVHGNHYVFDEKDPRYPDLAYEANPTGGGRGRWTWDQQRPRFIGEDYFGNGINPADYAQWGGEVAFQGKAQAHPAAGRIYRMLQEGYRWSGQSAWQFWLGANDAMDQYNANPWRAVFCRQWDWTFGAGQDVKRTFGIFNDTHSEDPITFTWTLTVGGKPAGTRSLTRTIPPGESLKYDDQILMPKVTRRAEGQLVLALSVNGHEVYRDAKPVSVVPPFRPATAARPTRERLPSAPNTAALARIPVPAGLGAAKLYVYDPQGSVVKYLQAEKIGFGWLQNLAQLPGRARVLIIGKDALDPREATSSRLAAWASAGRSVIVLEQKNPMKYQALPAQMEPDTTERRGGFGQEISGITGRTAFAEDLAHPVMRGLKQKDFWTWGPDGVVYRQPYLKPGRGGKSLVQCGPRLVDTALAEIPAGKGLILVSQLAVAEKLGSNPVTQQLLGNLIDYAAGYRQEFRQVAAAVGDDPTLAKALDQTGLQYARVSDPMAAITRPGVRLAIVSATPANLSTLAANLPKLQAWEQAGGYLVLHGLTPEGLAEYNRIVGFDHMIRPFRRERVMFPAQKHPLTSGLTTGDIVMLSGERIFDYTSDEYVAGDIFSYVVDYDEVAPFAKLPSDYLYNTVNGFVSADAWKLIYSFDLNSGPPEYTMSFPKPQELTRMEWIGNGFYHLVTGVELTFDGRNPVEFKTQPNNEPQTFEIAPGHVGKDVHLKITDWAKVSKGANVVGIDNLRLWAKRPAEFYTRVRQLLNVGGLMDYPRGKGGTLLCNLLFKDAETLPVNAVKKRTILATLLRNLNAPFTGGSAVIAGASLEYQPVDLSKQANQYRDERGWFGDKRLTFGALPTGKQTFAGVPFQVYDFATSPVPTAVMLGGPAVPNNLPDAVRGIPVNRKADALFFLQTARLDRRRDEREVREKKQYELAHYVVTYADGQTVAVPVYAEINVDDYRQKEPQALPGAQLAWSRPWEGTDVSATAWVQQWDNLRPGVQIRSVGLEYPGGERRGVPVLLAVTAASAARPK